MRTHKALIVGVHQWNSPLRVGNHYVTKYLLSKGFEVAYLSAPVTPLHQLLPETDDLIQRRENNAAGGYRERQGELWHYVPRALLAPDNRRLLSSSFVLNHWQKLSVPNVVETVKNAGFGEVDILFLGSIYQPFWLTAIDHGVSAYRLADHTSGFAGYSRAAKSVEERIISQVNMVFTASRGLQEYALANGAKAVQYLANGVDLERFSNTTGRKELDLPSFPGPVAVYVGAFGHWFDHATVLQLAEQRPDLTILLIGPMGPGTSEYEKYPNIHLAGAVPAGELPAYLSLANVGLIPFNVNKNPRLLNDVNPLKLYEYMAAGLPVVSYRWDEIEQLNSPATLVESRGGFVRAVSTVVEQGSAGEQERLFAGQYDWSRTLEPLGDWIDRNVH